MAYRNKIIFFLIAVVGLFSLPFLVGRHDMRLFFRIAPGDVQIGRALFHTEIVSDPASRTQGLSGRAGLSENGGMLFLFPEPGIYSFWMKDMQFPIDILWIENGKVVFIAEDVRPPRDSQEFPTVVSPHQAADMVLEVSAGSVQRFGITVGASVTAQLPRNLSVR